MDDDRTDSAGTGRTTDGRRYVLRHRLTDVVVVHRRPAGEHEPEEQPDYAHR